MAESRPVLANRKSQGIPIAVQINPHQVLGGAGRLTFYPPSATARMIDAASRSDRFAQAFPIRPGEAESDAQLIDHHRRPQPVGPVGGQGRGDGGAEIELIRPELESYLAEVEKLRDLDLSAMMSSRLLKADEGGGAGV